MGSVEMFYFSRTFSGLAMDHWTVSQSDHICIILGKLMAVGIFSTNYTKRTKKSYFFLNGRPFIPPPHLMALLLRKELFCGFPYLKIKTGSDRARVIFL